MHVTPTAKAKNNSIPTKTTTASYPIGDRAAALTIDMRKKHDLGTE